MPEVPVTTNKESTIFISNRLKTVLDELKTVLQEAEEMLDRLQDED